MKTNFLGDTGVRVSRLCLGTMAFGGDADEATSAAIYSAARDAGINFFDCADVYAGGRSETILGALCDGHRDEIVVATKAYFPTGAGPNDRGSSRYHLVRAVEASLRRLKTDRVDLFFLHRFDEHTPLEETLRAVEDLVRDGKILYPAVSNFSAWQTMKALGLARHHGWAPVVCAQPMYNLAKRQAEVEILPLAAAEGVGVLPYSPLGGGLLSGKYGVDLRPPAGRLVDNQMYGVRYGAASNYELAARFVAYAQDRGHHPATLAIAWVAAHPAVTAPLVGARNLEQLDPLLAAVSVSSDRNEESSAHNYGAR